MFDGVSPDEFWWGSLQANFHSHSASVCASLTTTATQILVFTLCNVQGPGSQSWRKNYDILEACVQRHSLTLYHSFPLEQMNQSTSVKAPSNMEHKVTFS